MSDEIIYEMKGEVAVITLNRPEKRNVVNSAMRDAVLAVRIPFVELHLSNIFAREPERRHSVIADLAIGLVAGFGAQSYLLALQGLVGRLRGG